MSKATTMGLLVGGWFLLATGRIKHPSIEPFADAATTLGGLMLAFANTNGLWAKPSVDKP